MDSDSPLTLFPPFAVLIGLHQSSSWAFSFLVNFPCNTFHMSICLLSPPHVSLPQTPVWKCLQNSPQISWQTFKQNTVPSQSLCFGNCVSLVSIASFLFDYLHLLNVVSQHFTRAIFHQMERKEGLWCCLWKWEWEKCQEWPSPQTFKLIWVYVCKGLPASHVKAKALWKSSLSLKNSGRMLGRRNWRLGVRGRMRMLEQSMPSTHCPRNTLLWYVRLRYYTKYSWDGTTFLFSL